MGNIDMSDRAILERYKKANLTAIAITDSTVFASLMDVFSLVQERDILIKQLRKLEEQLDAQTSAPKTS